MLKFTFSLTLAAITAGNWPQWRGPSHNGIAESDAPVAWGDSKNIAWKAAIPGRGHSTPVVWGDRIYLTTAISSTPVEAPKPPAPPPGPPPGDRPAGIGPGGPGGPGGQGRPGGGRRGFGGPGGGPGKGIEHKFVVMSLDRKTGKVLWERVANVAAPHEGYHAMYGSFASNSPVTDGKYVWASFGSRGLYCYDIEGKLIWSKDFPPMRMRNEFGEGTAPTLAGNRLIISFDAEADSFITVLDKTTGKELWRQERDEPSAWAQPLVVRHAGRDQLIVSATKRVRSYDLETGKLIWECGGLGANVIPAPVHRDGIVYVMSGFRDPNLLAIKLGREGDLTDTDAVLWTNKRGNSYTASPVLEGDKLYFVTDNGQISCFDALTGKPYYHQQRFPKPYNIKASPVAAKGKLYVATEDGDVVVVRMGEQFEVLATNNLADEFFIASPVILDGAIYLRGRNTLYCIRQ